MRTALGFDASQIKPVKSDGKQLIGSSLHRIRTECSAASEQSPMPDGPALPTDHCSHRFG